MELVYGGDGVKSTSSLTYRQINEFYNLMKEAVWKIEVIALSDTREKENERIRSFCTGVCISSDGLILTHSFKNEKVLNIRLFGPDNIEYSNAEIVKHDSKSGLALLSPTQKKNYDYVKFVDDINFYIDKKVYAILYPKESIDPIILKGYVAYDCQYTTDACSIRRTIENLDKDECAFPLGLGEEVPLVQIGQLGASDEFREELNSYARFNFYGLAEGRGCPVFEATGNLVGVVAFQQSQYDFAIHIDEIKKFVKLGKKKRLNKRKNKSEASTS